MKWVAGRRVVVVSLLSVGSLVCLTRSIAGCSGVEDVTTSALCDDAIQAISQKTLSCTRDVALANRRYDRMIQQERCKTDMPVGADTEDPRFQCTQAIERTSCADAEKHGDNLAAWLTSPSCPQLFDTSGQDGGTNDGGLTDGGAP